MVVVVVVVYRQVTFYARATFMEKTVQIKHKIPITTVYFLVVK
jgi:hypothetical protein